jgi:sarcosine/dimethylglycine N-methyltransferase
MKERTVSDAQRIASVAQAYYDSPEADEFYFQIWGGEDIHVGLYDSPSDPIPAASRRTVEAMADEIRTPLGERHRVLDVGAGYGGPARYLAKRFGSRVTCLNISEVENARNRKANRDRGLEHLVGVRHGSFDSIPEPDGSFHVVWSQDAILHSGDRDRVIAEVARVLKPGGEFVFTDPMQADDCPPGVLQPVYDRIHLSSLGSVRFYRDAAARHGLAEVAVRPMPQQLRTHYAAVRAQLERRYDELVAITTREYVDRMLIGLKNWVDAADRGHLNWGILHFRKQ